MHRNFSEGYTAFTDILFGEIEIKNFDMALTKITETGHKCRHFLNQDSIQLWSPLAKISQSVIFYVQSLS
jgi:hypothetical protein